MTPQQPVVLFVEDESFVLREFTKVLSEMNCRLIAVADPDEALRHIEGEPRIDLLLTDVQMALRGDTLLSQMEAKGGRWAGVALARKFRRRFPAAPVVFWTALYDSEFRGALNKLGNTRLISKRQDAMAVIDEIRNAIEGIQSGERPRIFIVHGHDRVLLDDVRNFLAGDLRLPEPTILKETASLGSTLIEKIEREALNIDLVIVLLTPDDHVVSSDGKMASRRARQNVIFELGYFMGLLGREHGQIVILFKDDVEVPTDIQGVLMIDVTHGTGPEKESIKREIQGWLG